MLYRLTPSPEEGNLNLPLIRSQNSFLQVKHPELLFVDPHHKILWISILMRPSRGGVIIVVLHTDNCFCVSYYGFPLLITWAPLSVQKYQAQHYESTFFSCPANIQLFIHCFSKKLFLFYLRYFSFPLGMDRNGADFGFFLAIDQGE